MIQVGINGYGTIGKRVADAVCLQPDMTLVGVAKTRPNYEAEAAVRKGYPLYAGRPERAGAFGDAGVDLQGELDDLVLESDVVVDATPAGVGAENAERYAALDTPAIVQGGESAAIADASFVARANYAAATDSDLVRVVSCNTTGLSRLLAPLSERYGIERARATLIRRGGDPDQPDRGPINDILPDPRTIPSHHGPDVGTILPTVDITTVGVTVPATLMHLHSVNLTLESSTTAAEVAALLAAESRLCVLPERLDIAGTAQLKAPGGQRRPREHRCDPGDHRHRERHREHPADEPPTRLGDRRLWLPSVHRRDRPAGRRLRRDSRCRHGGAVRPRGRPTENHTAEPKGRRATRRGRYIVFWPTERILQYESG